MALQDEYEQLLYRLLPPGPAWEMVAPEATNRPVPIDPPMAIMVRWRAFNARFSAGCCVVLDSETIGIYCPSKK